MQIDADKLLENSLRDAMREAAKSAFHGYNSPMAKLIEAATAKHSPMLKAILEDAIAECVNDKEFRAEITAAARASLAKTLVQRFGGEMEKQVNTLKSDPTTRARITIAIEDILKSKGS